MAKPNLEIAPTGGIEVCKCDQYVEEARSLLAVALGLLAKEPSLKFSYLEMLGLERILKEAFEGLARVEDLHNE